MNKAFLCLGGNLGNRLKLISECKDLIEKNCGKITSASRIYETEAWGSSSKNRFLNQVIIVNTRLGASGLLKKLKAIENHLGRKKNVPRNSDRTADIDILFFNDEIISSAEVEIPHPRLHLRKFVLKPLLDLDAKFVHPVFHKSIKKLYRECKDTLDVKEFKPFRYICVEGNIGSGKTTLAKALVKELKSAWLPEEFEKNRLLPLFYKDPATYAFPLEYSFLISRFQHIAGKLENSTGDVVSDYTIYKCLWFARHNLNQKEFRMFKKHFMAFERQLPVPDLIIFLDTDTANLVENIKKRGRSYERQIPLSYLEKVRKEYINGLNRLKKTRILRFHIKKYHEGLQSRLIKKIKKNLD